jgi:hypothetical protein
VRMRFVVHPLLFVLFGHWTITGIFQEQICRCWSDVLVSVLLCLFWKADCLSCDDGDEVPC